MAGRKMVETSEDEPLENGNSHWHLVRGVPVVFIATMTVYAFINAVVGGWYASAMNSRIDALEKLQAQMSAASIVASAAASSQGERLARLEEKVVSVQATASRIETILTPVKTRDR
jgi:carbon starvation protein CstA